MVASSLGAATVGIAMPSKPATMADAGVVHVFVLVNGDDVVNNSSST